MRHSLIWKAPANRSQEPFNVSLTGRISVLPIYTTVYGSPLVAGRARTWYLLINYPQCRVNSSLIIHRGGRMPP